MRCLTHIAMRTLAVFGLLAIPILAQEQAVLKKDSSESASDLDYTRK